MSTAVPPPSSPSSSAASSVAAASVSASASVDSSAPSELLPGVVRVDRPAAPERRAAADAVAPSQAGRRSAFRPDIEGLRGVAVLAVLAYHAAVPGLAGGYVGVDVFFVISGFLITGLLLGRPIGLWDFAARRARRILPAAATVLVATAAAGGALLDPLRGTDLARDLIAAAGQFANWRFVGQQTDYLAAGRDPSPLQHFWSLGVENQFYLLWGVLLLGLARYLHGRRRTIAITIATTAIGAVSLLLCVRWTATSAPLAYFSTASRLWEFAAGACAALLGGALTNRALANRALANRALANRALAGREPAGRVPGGRERGRGTAWTLRVLGWGGAAAVLGSVLSYDRDTPFPGTAALLPVLGTAAVLLAGPAHRALGATDVGRLLATRPLRAAGRLSYAWYLWHWPVLTIAQARYGALPWTTLAALAAASALPAWLTMRLVEQPLRYGSSPAPRRGLAVGASALVIPLIAALTLGGGTVRALGGTADAPVAAPAGAPSGPALLAPGARVLGLTPSLARAREDFPPGKGCEIALNADSSPRCLFGAEDSPDRIVLIGDSHAGQWISAALAMAGQRHWALEVLVKPGCPLATLTVRNNVLGRTFEECDRWRENSLTRLTSGPRPRLVLMAGLNRYGSQEERVQGWTRTLDRLAALGAPLAYLGDTPMPGKDIPTCLAASDGRSDACFFPRDTAFEPDPMLDGGLAARYGVRTLDLGPLLCPGSGPDCPAVLEGVVLYRDTGHITDTLARVLAPRLDKGLLEAAG
ncbi:peptidoglycan/LPS O-acetylase OafA/YrhL [Kitasatospora sp. MAA19]|uniref:acyltransferase family protein n=1 Tax=Kitasatospora sp. MAA19 TaxID=3035090 RepID=UPI002475A6CC|nr:acyltransferase family protein [Kitasatospora sp. MAA19]MDH6708900.1 peptidoglycan/LPS O-acetylase OafA/YrhL [Kitasatospora sp. MAA19]